MEPAMPMVLAQSLLAPRLPVSLWALSLATPCTSSLHRRQHTAATLQSTADTTLHYRTHRSLHMSVYTRRVETL